MLPSVQPGKLDAALVLFSVSAVNVVLVGVAVAVVVVLVVVGELVAVGAVADGFCELADPFELDWLALAPLPHATLRERANMSVPKRNFFI